MDIGRFLRLPGYKLLALLLLLVCCFGPELLERDSGIHITVLPAGQGDSSIFEFPDGRIMVIDGGPREDYLLSSLRRKKISKIDILVLSHPDADHVVGFFEVLEKFEVGEIWHSGFDQKYALMRKFLSLADQKKIPIKTVPDLLGEHRIGEGRVTVLAPVSFDPTLSTNNNSLVIKVSFGEDSALWPGDLESEQEQLASPAWKAKILKAPHHGSKSSSSEYLVKMVSPKHVIFCTQAENSFGFPNPVIMKRWQAAQAKTWDTGTQGMIDIILTGGGVLVKSYL